MIDVHKKRKKCVTLQFKKLQSFIKYLYKTFVHLGILDKKTKIVLRLVFKK